MWYTFVGKCAAVATATVVAVGLVWAAEEGAAGNSKRAGGADAKAVDLKLAAAPEKKQAAATTAEDSNRQTAAKQRQIVTNQLNRRIEDLREMLQMQMKDKVMAAIQMEQLQMDKTALQREMEQIRGKLIELQVAGIAELSPVVQERRTKVVAEMEKQMAEARRKLTDYMQKTVAFTELLERRQLDVTRTQRRIDEFDRAAIQLELPPEAVGAGQPAAMSKKDHGEELLVENFKQFIAQIQQERERSENQRQNAATATPQLTISQSGNAETRRQSTNRLLPGDQVIVSVVAKDNAASKVAKTDKNGKANTTAWRGFTKVATVDQEGKLDLHEGFGPVEIGGLDKSKAADAVRNALKQPNMWGEVRVERVEQPQPAATATGTGTLTLMGNQHIGESLDILSEWENSQKKIEVLQQALEKARAENADLKKRLERHPASAPKANDRSGKVVQPGDQIAIVQFDKKSGAKKYAQIVTVDKRGRITKDSEAGWPFKEVSGMEGRQAEDAIRKALEKRHPEDEIRVEVLGPPEKDLGSTAVLKPGDTVEVLFDTDGPDAPFGGNFQIDEEGKLVFPPGLDTELATAGTRASISIGGVDEAQATKRVQAWLALQRSLFATKYRVTRVRRVEQR
jgi:hypothetical protein